MIKGRVKETSATSGTGTLNLDGAVSGFRSFVSAFGTGRMCYYVILDGTAWEVGIGLVTSGSPNTLSRLVVVDSSASGAKLTLSAGTKVVFNDIPGDLLFDSAGSPNLITNGMMESWQHGTTITDPTIETYAADGFKYFGGAAVHVDVRRSTNVPTLAQAGVLFNYSLEVDVTTADGSIGASDQAFLHTFVNGFDWRHYAQRPFVLSFWVMSTKTGIYSLSLHNTGGDRDYIAEFTINAADTWEFKTLLIPASPSAGTWDYTTGCGLQMYWFLAAGSNFTGSSLGAWGPGLGWASTNQVNGIDSASNFFRLTGVRTNLGFAPSLPQFRPRPLEDVICKQMFQKSFLAATTPAQNAGALTGEHLFIAGKAGATAQMSHVIFPVPMRVAPTVTLYNPSAGNAQVRDETFGGDCSASSAINITEKGFTIQTTGNASTAVGNRLGVHWTASCEF